MTKVRLSIDSPEVVIPRITPEYQYPPIRFYCLSPFSSMIDAASSDLAAAAGSSTSILPSATDLAAVTVAAASSEANMQPPSSIGVNVTATAVTMAASIADDAR